MQDDKRAELLARIIEPDAWDDALFGEPGTRSQNFAQCAALSKARHCLAALTDETPQVGQPGVGEAVDTAIGSARETINLIRRKSGGVTLTLVEADARMIETLIAADIPGGGGGIAALRASLEALVSEDVVYLTGAEKDADEAAIFVTVADVRRARAALSDPLAGIGGEE